MEFGQFEFNEKDKDEIFKNLVEKALRGEQSPFEFIRSYNMLSVARAYRSGVKKVAKIFASLEKSLLKTYQLQIADGSQNIETLAAAIQFRKCKEYYTKEFKIAKDMISEFRTYVFSGHIIQTMLGGMRPEEECVDYRKLPIKFW